MRALGSWLARIGAVLIALFVVFGGFFAWRLFASLPRTEGELEIAGLSSPAYIVRDRHAVPHIFANDAEAAAFTLGVAHAQDRLWQMHFTRAAMRGRLSEIMGEATVPIDARMRVFDLGGAADALAGTLSAADHAYFQAYADGVNSFIMTDGFAPPPEFLLLAERPEPWTVADVILIYKAIALDLVGGELWRMGGEARLRSVLSEAQIGQFLAPYPDDGPRAVSVSELAQNRNGAALNGPDASPEAAGAIPDPYAKEPEGSNNWVVNGTRTTTGLPLLANDPHLGFTTPGIWYLARLSTPDGSLVGVTLPGAPDVVLGHNTRFAWGFTNTGTDVADVLVRPEGALNITGERTETIKVRFGDPVELTVRETADGVVLPREWFSAAAVLPEGRAAVLVWPLDDPDDLTSTIGRRLARAQGWSDMMNALEERFVVPAQNIVYADTRGDIGFVAPGRTPLRGEDGRWTGEVPFAELPQVYNPRDGMVVTANNQIPPDDYPHFLTRNWADPYRARRITELLISDRSLSPADFQAIQTDVVSGHATRILPRIWDAAPETEAGQAALNRLRNWNGAMRREWAEPLIFAAWLEQFSRAVYADELNGEFARFFTPRGQFIEDVVSGEAEQWCDNVATPGRSETCLAIAGPALDRAVARLAEEYGRDMERWRWGEAHPAYFPHRPFGEFPVLDSLFSTRVPAPGDGSTINVAHFPYGAENYAATHGASYRAIYNLADLNSSKFIIPVGQSGHVLSRHYRDLAQPWADGDYFEIRYDWRPDEAPDGADRLILRPAD